MESNPNTMIIRKTRLASSLKRKGWEFSGKDSDVFASKDNIIVRLGTTRAFIYKVFGEKMVLIEAFAYGKGQLGVVEKAFKNHGGSNVSNQIQGGLTETKQ